MDIEDILAEGKSSGSEDEKPRAAKKARNCDVFSGSAMWFAISIHFLEKGKTQDLNQDNAAAFGVCILFFHLSERMQEERKTKGKAEPKRKELKSHMPSPKVVNWNGAKVRL